MKRPAEQDQDFDQIINQLSLEEKAALTAGKDLWHSAALAEPKIPALKMTDGPNGVRGEARDTHPVTSASFPVGSALGATWNEALVHDVGKALAEEAHSKQAQILLGPTVNIHRTPLAGRNFECFSEDPFLTSQLAVAYIKGVQSQGVAACIKHFVCNDQEYERFTISAEVSLRALHEIYLPPFKAAVLDGGVWTIMSAYNRVNSVYASENEYLLNHILKEKWGFDGLVISDWYGTYSEKAAKSGCDLEMPGPSRWMGATLVKEVEEGKLDLDRLNDQIQRLLRTITRVQAAEGRDRRERAVDRPAHRELIRQAGEEAIVLLKNDHNILPLDPAKTNTLGVIGQLADQVSFQGGGSSQVAPHYVVSPLESLRSEFAGAISYAAGYDINKQPPPIDKAWMPPSAQGAPGFQVKYYDNPDLAGDPVHQAETEISALAWFGETASHWDPNSFSLSLQGRISAPRTGRYRLTLSLIGRGRVYLDQELILDAWDTPAGEKKLDLMIDLEQEAAYTLQIDYASELDLRWREVRLGAEEITEIDLVQRAEQIAANSDIVLLVAGMNPEWEAEGFDRPDLNLPANQDELIFRIAEINPNTIVVLNCGAPVQMPWIDKVRGVLQMWYLGQESGTALSQVLLGSVNPSGRLPTTFPKSLEDTPAFKNYPGADGKVNYREDLFIGYRHFDRAETRPLFPFGFGLSYTQFEYEELHLQTGPVQEGGKLRFSFQLRNAGDRAGKEVAQVYIGREVSPQFRPLKELKAFRKVQLEAQQSTRIEIELDLDALKHFDERLENWVLESGTYTLFVGSSAENIHLKDTFIIGT